MPRLLSAPLLLLAALSGCELAEVTTSPTEEVLVVEATLRAGEPVQRLLLHRSVSAGGAGSDAATQVTVTGASGVVVPFQPAPRDECTGEVPEEHAGTVASATCFLSPASAGSWVEPGAEYALSVRTDDGRAVTGRTTVPGAFRLTSPRLPVARGYTCRIPPNTALPLVWTLSEGTWAYLTVLVIQGLDAALGPAGIEAPDRLELRGVLVSARDTTITLPTDFLFDGLDLDRDLLLAIRDGLPEGTTLELGVAAADRNYVNAVRGAGFNPSGQVRISSVAGDGVGYFGSLVPLRLEIVVTADATVHPPCAPAV